MQNRVQSMAWYACFPTGISCHAL